MKNKYLFLDFDGVLNSNKNYRTLQMLGVPTRDEYGTIFDSKCVECLRDIIDTIEIKIVITSSWRFIYDMNMLCGMWRVRELPGYIYGMTPTNLLLDPAEEYIKGKEIDCWFKRTGCYCEESKYAILDDEQSFLSHQQSHLVLTNPETGIIKNDVNKILEILL